MDPARNPFAPGAGNPPPELAGRDAILGDVEIAIRRVMQGRHARGQVLLGLRGVGKTVLLNEISTLAEKHEALPVEIEAPGADQLATLIVPKLRRALLQFSKVEKAKDLARNGMRVLQAFATAFKVTAGGVEVGMSAPEPELASGRLDLDFPDLLVTVGRAAKEADTAVVLVIDEVQYLSESELGALIVAIHAVNQKQLPVLFFGGGLPQLAGLAGDAKSYAERLLQFPQVGALSREAAIRAIRKPLQDEQVVIEDDAMEAILHATQAYPYFLQEWGAHAWNAAEKSPITADDVARATVTALQHLDNDFFKVRLDRLTPREKDYLRGMAELGQGSHRSGAIAKVLGATSTEVGFLRGQLINKGMIYSQQYGMTDFTVPMFADFMRRAIPDWRPGATDGAEEAEDGAPAPAPPPAPAPAAPRRGRDGTTGRSPKPRKRRGK